LLAPVVFLFCGIAHADSAKLVNSANGRSYQRFDTALDWNSAKTAEVNAIFDKLYQQLNTLNFSGSVVKNRSLSGSPHSRYLQLAKGARNEKNVFNSNDFILPLYIMGEQQQLG
jgi:hypothetical protein